MPPSIVARGLLPVGVTNAPTLSVEGPRSVPSRISVVLVDGTMAGDTPRRECPREDLDLRPRAGVTRPAGVSVGGDNDGPPRDGGTLSPPLMLPGGSCRLCLPGGSSPAWCCKPCWPRWPGCCRWPRWPMWDVVSTFSRSSGTVRAFGSGSCWPCWPACCCWPCGPVIHVQQVTSWLMTWV